MVLRQKLGFGAEWRKRLNVISINIGNPLIFQMMETGNPTSIFGTYFINT